MLSGLGRTTLRTVTRPTGSNQYRTRRYNIVKCLAKNLDRNNHRKFCRGKNPKFLYFFEPFCLSSVGSLKIKILNFEIKIRFQNYHFAFRQRVPFTNVPVKATYAYLWSRPRSLKLNLTSLDPEWHSKCQKYDFSNIWFFVYLLCLNFFRCQNLFFTSFEIFPFCDSNQWPLYPQILTQ